MEAENAGSLAFFTLTYDEGNVPFLASSVVDGEICDQFYTDSLDLSGYLVYRSLRRKDVQSWLKRFRQDYFRRHNERCDLRYSFFGEYGEKTQRPHYHLIVYGLDKSECERLRRSWQFGFADMRFVPRFNSDGSDAFVKVSRYISKYISKGQFLPGFVKDGFAEKPRQQSSIRLGVRGLDVVPYRNFTLPAISWIPIDYNQSLNVRSGLSLQALNLLSLENLKN